LADEIYCAAYATAILSYKDFEAAAVSQASSTVTDGIKGLPTWDTRLIVTL
jgi:hypothetical protein